MKQYRVVSGMRAGRQACGTEDVSGMRKGRAVRLCTSALFAVRLSSHDVLLSRKTCLHR